MGTTASDAVPTLVIHDDNVVTVSRALRAKRSKAESGALSISMEILSSQSNCARESLVVKRVQRISRIRDTSRLLMMLE